MFGVSLCCYRIVVIPFQPAVSRIRMCSNVTDSEMHFPSQFFRIKHQDISKQKFAFPAG